MDGDWRGFFFFFHASGFDCVSQSGTGSAYNVKNSFPSLFGNKFPSIVRGRRGGARWWGGHRPREARGGTLPPKTLM